MFYNSIPLIKPRVIPPLDDSFRPAVLWNYAFLNVVRSSGEEIPLTIGLERGDGSISVFRTQVFPQNISWLRQTYYMLNG